MDDSQSEPVASFPTELVMPLASDAFELVGADAPAYETNNGALFACDALDLLASLPTGSVNLVVTSPPYALHFKKEYGNADQGRYADWLLPYCREIRRVLADDGSFALNIGGAWTPGIPVRSLYQYRLLLRLVDEIGFHLAQELFWYNPAKMPTPAEWVNVRKIRIKDSVEFIWWLSKTPWPRADNDQVLLPYSPDMERLARRGLKGTRRPSGHQIKASFANVDRGGSTPPNLLGLHEGSNLIVRGNNASNDSYYRLSKLYGLPVHPARFPQAIPEFFVRLCTRGGDLVVDPFAGSNMTGYVAETLGRRWLCSEANADYASASQVRFFA